MRLPAICALALAVLSTSCVHTVERHLLPAGEAGRLDRASPFLKIHLRDGRAYVLTKWDVERQGAAVTGDGTLLGPGRETMGTGRFTVPIDSVALFETNVTHTHPAIGALALISGVSAAVTILCIASPKTCFGSCPTFYAWDGEHEALQAEGFSGSVAPCLEAGDLDALPRARTRGGEVRLTMRNEALETQVVRRADLLAAPRPPGGRVYAGPGGVLLAGDPPRAPLTAIGPEGPCAAALAALDGNERVSLADSANLGARESIRLTFPPPGPGRFGLVIGARQSLLSTYLFYQALAWMGRGAGEWFADLERGDATTRRRAMSAHRLVDSIEVEVRADGGWRACGAYGELGPIATDEQVVRLPRLGDGPVEVRLTCVQGAWRLDQVGLVRLGAAVEPVRLAPVRALRGEVDDAEALSALRGGAVPLVTRPGDALTLVYRLPPGEHELFLESRGYYLEWMRDEWLAEQDPGRLVELFLDPRGAMRRLAPEYKRQEGAMEASFWGSRYAHP
jgi:hypothetical protein